MHEFLGWWRRTPVEGTVRDGPTIAPDPVCGSICVGFQFIGDMRQLTLYAAVGCSLRCIVFDERCF